MTNTYNIIYAVLIVGFFKLYLFYNDYETSYITYINHARGHRCLRSVVFVWEESGVPGGNSPVWLDDHMIISHAEVVLCCI